MLSEVLQAVVPIGLVTAQLKWQRELQELVPAPYLDEFFHIPQAQVYWKGNWSQWDDKITTPPGLYLYSILVNKVYKFDSDTADLTTYDLRRSNTLLFYLMLLVLTIWARFACKNVPSERFLQKEYCIVAFPFFFFFSGLYYTDLFSAFTVMVTYAIWQASVHTKSHFKVLLQLIFLLSGLISLSARQTNIFWVAVYLGGLQAVNSIKKRARIHDPPIQDAYFEDLPITVISLVTSALSSIPSLLLDLWPHLCLLGSFAMFVVWNGGVVLGDKTNHVATIHLAQLLYIWPFIVFFSWPATLPQLANIELLVQRLPRLWVVAMLILPMTAIVHFNTIVHMFLLADNRHYTFYAFKILRSASWTWYALIPVYAISGWLLIQALGTRPTVGSRHDQHGNQIRRASTSSGGGGPVTSGEDENRISFLIVWSVSTALSLVTAPLVEPRYFIVPWLIWRLHIPDLAEVVPRSRDEKTHNSVIERMKSLLTEIAKQSLWIELVWYMLINWIVCYMFLYKGFEWPQEPGQVQRFMW